VSRLAWGLFGASVLLSGAGVALLTAVPAEALERADNSLVLSVTFVLVLLVFALVGAVVASRLPANPIGWLFLALALIEGVYELSFGYAHYTFSAEPGALPGGEYAAWVSNWSSPLSPAILGLALLLFPDGRVPSPRWRPLAWACGAATVPVLAHHGFAPGSLAEFPGVANPLGIEGATFLRTGSIDAVVTAVFLAAIASLIVRFRRSRGIERQQLKWLAYAVGLMAVYFVVGGIAFALAGADAEGESYAAGFVFAALICGVPVSAGLAILRYRLYDIDVVINRTLVYGALSATLAAVYVGLVLLLGLALGPLTEDSRLAVAGSTLAVAGLFRPARGRIQAAVDRRFYRGRYDAARTLEAFAARLRDEVDLESVSGELRAVVRKTVQPANVSLWLRERPR